MSKKKIHEIELLYSISRNFYLSPFRIGKFISSWPNSLFHSRRNGQTVVTVKWRETTQPEKINIWIWNLKFSREIWNMTYKMYIMTPSDQISQDLSYRSGPNTSGAAKINNNEVVVNFKMIFWKKYFSRIFRSWNQFHEFFNFFSYRHNKGCNMEFAMYFANGFPWQIQNQWVLGFQIDLNGK